MKGKKINKLIDFRIGQINSKDLFNEELNKELDNKFDN
jgi:hypothetical protein